MPPADRRHRLPAWGWLAVTTAGFVVAVVFTTPWDWLPGGELAPIDPTAGLTAAQLQRIAAYRVEAVPLALLGTLVPLLLTCLLGFTSWGARLVRRLPGGRRWWLATFVAGAVLLLIGRIVALAYAIRAEQVSHRVRLSTQPWSSWAFDQLKAYAVAALVTGVLVVVAIGLRRRVRRWWLPASLFAAALVVVGSFAYPLLVEPLFARFTPMPGGALRSSLLALAARDGVPVDEVLVADASQRTTALNAYVSGFGATKRIVVYDTLLKQATPVEVRLVVAHELGHAKAGDVLRETLVGALGAAAGVTALSLLIESSWMRRTAGYGDPRDAAVVPAVLALVALGSFLVGPLQNVISRAIEARADVHALNLTADPGAFIDVQRRLAVTNLSPPDPARVLYLWYATHPTASQRIALAEGWAAEPGR